MADEFVPISGLNPGRNVLSTDLLVAVQNGQTVKVTGQQVRPRFEALLQGTSVVLLGEDHGLEVIRSVRVVNPAGSLVEVEMRILGADIEILSNISLDGHRLFLE